MTHPLPTLRAAVRRGLTLTEGLLFLAVAALVIVAAVFLYNNITGSRANNDALTQINSYTSGMKSLYSSQSSYGTVSLVEAAINGGIAPRNAINGAGTGLVNPWGGDTTIVGQTNAFYVRMTEVPQDACVRMLSAGLLTQGSIFAIRAGSGATTAAAPTSSSTSANNGAFVATEPPTPADAATVCSDGATNVMTFYVR